MVTYSARSSLVAGLTEVNCGLFRGGPGVVAILLVLLVLVDRYWMRIEIGLGRWRYL